MDPHIKFWKNLHPLEEDAAQALADAAEERHFKKGDFLLQEGKTCHSLYFIDQGLIKMSFLKDGKEFIMRFFPENSLLTGLDSFILQQPSNYALVAMEDTAASAINRVDIERLTRQYPGVEHAYRKFYEMVSLNMMKRITEMLEEDGTQRYKSFIQHNGHLLQRISLGDLAAYLGITQVSLSRIRARQ